MLKDLVGGDSATLTLPEGALLRDVLIRLQKENERLRQVFPSIAASVNQEYAVPNTKLKHGDEIALLPPVSGGTGHPPSAHAAITHETIQTQQVLNEIKRPSDGAIAVFEGIVRDHTRGRRTLYLDYEAYEEMAIKQMEALACHALANFNIRDVRIIHRLGRLEIGEASVLIAVASEHRGAAFDACRWLIDTLKQTVPIWKKEHFEDGAVWADGEPFPVEIPRAEGTH